MKINTSHKLLTIFGILSTVVSIGLLVKATHLTMIDEKEDLESALVGPLLIFTNSIFRVTSEEKKNVILSPVSVHSALNLLLLGSDSGSKSERELHDTLGYSGANSSALDIHKSYAKLIKNFKEIAKRKIENYMFNDNRNPSLDIWTMALTKGSSEPTQEYLKQVADYYQTSVHRVDDSKSDEKTKLLNSINSWGKKAGFQSDLLTKKDLDEQFRVILMSAIYVEAYWFKQFHKSKRPELFYNHGLSSKLVRHTEGLTRSQFRASYVEFSLSESKYPNHIDSIKNAHIDLYRELADLEFRMIKIDLVGDLTFTIIEPLKNGTGKELAELERKLLEVEGQVSRLGKALNVIDDEKSYGQIKFMQMPEFKFESEIDLKDPLRMIGLQSIFDVDQAHLSKLGSRQLFVDKVKHKATIEVNEKGLKAAAVTIVSVTYASLQTFRLDEPIEVLIQHPFMFVLRFKNLPLFVGHLVEV